MPFAQQRLEIVGEVVIHEPDEYFYLPIICAGGHARKGIPLPAVLLQSIGKVYRGKEWEAMGLDPYIKKIRYSDGSESWGTGGKFRLDGTYWGFDKFMPDYDQHRKTLARAIRSGKRCVQYADEAYTLRLLGIPYDEVINLAPQYFEYSEARLAMDRKEFELARKHAEAAIALNPKDTNYRRLLFEARLVLGDVSLIHDGIAYYKNDMDCAAHCGDAEKWLRLAMDQRSDYRLALDVVISVLEGLDRLISGKVSQKERIYGVQKRYHYENSKSKFIRRLGTLRNFLSGELVEQNVDRADTLRMLIQQIEKVAPEKAKKLQRFKQML